MTTGELIEKIIYIKRKYDICYPDDNAINLACNVLETFSQSSDIYDILAKDKERNYER